MLVVMPMVTAPMNRERITKAETTVKKRKYTDERKGAF